MALQVVQPMRKQETPAQWNKALQRALNEALDVLVEPATGATFVESSTMPGTLYRVTPHGCSCAAGARGTPCKHRACLLAQLGILPLDEGPAPAPVAQPVPLENCPACCGGGVKYDRHAGRYGWHPTCSVCQGSGTLPASRPEPMVSPPERIAA